MNPLHRFLLSVLVWLPICFGVWFFLSILFVAPLASIVDFVMVWLFPSLVERVAQDGNGLTVITRVVVSQAGADGSPAIGDIVLELNPLKYGYCVPLYTALVLASPGEGWPIVWRWLIGMFLLLIVQGFGVSTEILKELAFGFNEQFRAAISFSGLAYEALALAYQFGFLVLPSVAPIAIWFAQFESALPRIIGTPSR